MSWVAVAAAGVGLAKSELVDAPKAERQRQLASETQRYSPWTGLQAQSVQEADPFGSMLQYGSTGAALGQNMKTAGMDNELRKAQLEWFKQHNYFPAKGSPYSGLDK